MRALFAQPLARELTVALVVKVAALALIWFAFFREAPVVDPGRLLAPSAAPHQEARR